MLSVLALAGGLAAGDQSTLPWLYDEVNGRGPSQWGSLVGAGGAQLYPTCSAGRQQSPINIAQAQLDAGLQPLGLHYDGAQGIVVKNKVSAVELKPARGTESNYFVDPNLGNKKWKLLQIHFHAPSEHTIGGGFYDMEMHMVHVPADSQPQGADTTYDLSVIGVMFNVQKAANSHFSFFDRLPELPASVNGHRAYMADAAAEFNATEVTLADVQMMFGDMVSSGRYYTYDGSLTTPPCSERVRWIVMSDVHTISEAQLEYMETALGLASRLEAARDAGLVAGPLSVNGNYRPVQPRNGRRVRMFAASPGMAVRASPGGEDDNDVPFQVLASVGLAVAVLAVAAAVYAIVSRPAPAHENKSPDSL